MQEDSNGDSYLPLTDFKKGDEEDDDLFEDYIDDLVTAIEVHKQQEKEIGKADELMGKETELPNSDEVRSLGSSSKEKDLVTFRFSKFNEAIDFSRPIELKLVMLLDSDHIFRKALRWY